LKQSERYCVTAAAKRKRAILFAKGLTLLGIIPLLIYAFEYGPDAGYVGVPGENASCISFGCHVGTVNSNGGAVTVTFPSGLMYTPGIKQHLIVTITDPAQRRWGFELTARTSDPKTMAGTFTPSDGRTQVLCASTNLFNQNPGNPGCPAGLPLQYVEHTLAGYNTIQANPAKYEFDWTPPATNLGNITIYVAANAANGDLKETGDHIYTNKYTLTPAGGLPPIQITAKPNTLSFAFQQGGPTPSPQTISIDTGLTSVPLSITTSSAAWLKVSSSSANSPATLTVFVDPSGLNAGMYSGTIVVSSPSVANSPMSIAISLVINATPPPIPHIEGTWQVTARSQLNSLQFSANLQITQIGNMLAGSIAFNGNPCVTLVKFTGTVNTLLRPGVTLETTYDNGVPVLFSGELSADSSSLTGTYAVNGTGCVENTQRDQGNWVATRDLSPPTISTVINSASSLSGAVAPGEIISIKGSGIGPSTPAFLLIDQNGNASTSVGGVQVLFKDVPAPLTYVSSTQINAIVPYQTAAASNPYVQVRFSGKSSGPYLLTLANTAPGIFTLNGTGTGPAAVLNQDNSGNSARNPASMGTYVVLFATGEGQTTPLGVTGKITTISPQPPLTPRPLLPVMVLVNGQPADIAFYGEAPGLVSGVLQLNVQIPMTVPSGELPILISIGGISSQNGVTISVQ
jgi:uncharacterized protein (TIGR03437 family)